MRTIDLLGGTESSIAVSVRYLDRTPGAELSAERYLLTSPTACDTTASLSSGAHSSMKR